MAFPASPSNNQVHKEGNRSFVYDSTLGTWDQVRENDTHIAYQRGEIHKSSFPAGHVVNTTLKACTATLQLNQASEIFVSAANGIENLAVTAGNKLAIWFIGGNVYSSTNSPYYCGLQIRVNDNNSDTDYQSTISGHVGSDARFDPAVAFAFHTCQGTSIDIMYGLWGYTNNASTHYYLAAQHYTAGQADGLRFCVQEIQA